MIEFDKILNYKNKIKSCLTKQLFDQAEQLISDYEKINPDDFELYSLKANINFFKGDLDFAETQLLKAYNKLEFNFDVNYNLAIIYMYKKQYKKSIYHFLISILVNPKSLDTVSKEVENLIKNKSISMEDFRKIESKVLNIKLNRNKIFPFKDSTSTYIGDFLFRNNNSGYMCGYYDYYFPERDNILTDIACNENSLGLLSLFKTETLPSKKLKKISFTTTEKTTIPIMILDENSIVNLNINNVNHKLNNLLPKRFYYYTVDKDSIISLSSKNPFILGDLIELSYDKNKPRLILNIFIDGLSQSFLEDNDLQKVMPNTYKFFKEGSICDNCYVSGEWTYVNLASFFTGMYITEHMVFNPDYGTNNLQNKELFHQILNNEGYFTTKIDGDWRSTPSSGYVKGFNRYLYQPSIRGMHCDDIILETIEHLEAFKDKNNFMWVCIPDLHDVADEFETRLSTQMNNNISSRIFDKTSESSVRKNFDTRKIHKYKTQLKRIDTYLGLLLNYINDNYTDDEILISLVSDHGQGYLVKSDNFLDEERVKVPMMFKGLNIPKGICSELIQGLDLFPTILNSVNIKNFDSKQGNIPKYFGGTKERTYTYTESIFPGSPYRAVINDLDHKFFFSTKELCAVDGRFKAFEYDLKLINKHTNKEETDKFKDKVDYYLNIVFDHIKELLILE